MSAPHVPPSRALEAACAADRRACDRLAAALDQLLPHAALLRTIGVRLLTRPISRSEGSTVVAIARELNVRVHTLTPRIYRAAGASIQRLRREMIVVRLAAIAEAPGLCWPLVAAATQAFPGVPPIERRRVVDHAGSRW